MTKSKKEKIFWYEFFDERNQRSYEVGFHEDGSLSGYRSFGSTKTVDDILREWPGSEDASAYIYETMKMVGKFEVTVDYPSAEEEDK